MKKFYSALSLDGNLVAVEIDGSVSYFKSKQGSQYVANKLQGFGFGYNAYRNGKIQGWLSNDRTLSFVLVQTRMAEGQRRRQKLKSLSQHQDRCAFKHCCHFGFLEFNYHTDRQFGRNGS
jgi:hypothetical protein